MVEGTRELGSAPEMTATSAISGPPNLQVLDASLYLSPPKQPRVGMSPEPLGAASLEADGLLCLSPAVTAADILVGEAVTKPFELGAGKLEFGERMKPLPRMGPFAPPRPSLMLSPVSPSACKCPGLPAPDWSP